MLVKLKGQSHVVHEIPCTAIGRSEKGFPRRLRVLRIFVTESIEES
jgi:hypothetical protein